MFENQSETLDMFNVNVTSDNDHNESNKLILDLKKRIEIEFNESDWSEIGLLVNAHQIIDGHSRLLRSFSWGG